MNGFGRLAWLVLVIFSPLVRVYFSPCFFFSVLIFFNFFRDSLSLSIVVLHAPNSNCFRFSLSLTLFLSVCTVERRITTWATDYTGAELRVRSLLFDFFYYFLISVVSLSIKVVVVFFFFFLGKADSLSRSRLLLLPDTAEHFSGEIGGGIIVTRHWWRRQPSSFSPFLFHFLVSLSCCCCCMPWICCWTFTRWSSITITWFRY